MSEPEDKWYALSVIRRLRSQGFTWAAIADHLCLSQAQVRAYRARMRKYR